MISKSYIRNNLKEIDRLYNKSTTQKGPLYFSKLAIIELCGWIEVSTDDIVCRAVRIKVNDSKKYARFHDGVVQPNYGFNYKKNFRKMICSAVGEIIVHDIEKKMDQLKYKQLESELGALTQSRNTLAHTYIKGITQSIDAPSRTISRFELIYSGLKEFEKELFRRI